MNIVRRIWNDDAGFVVSAELVLVSVILVIGMIVGLTTMRDQLVQEFGDMGLAVGALNQSYSFSGATVGGFTVAGSTFADLPDDCDGPDVSGSPPACIAICSVNASDEG